MALHTSQIFWAGLKNLTKKFNIVSRENLALVLKQLTQKNNTLWTEPTYNWKMTSSTWIIWGIILLRV